MLCALCATAIAGCDEIMAETSSRTEPYTASAGTNGDCSVEYAVEQLRFGVGEHEWPRVNTPWLISHLPETVSRNPHLAWTETRTVSSTSFWHIAATPPAGWSLRHQFCFSGVITFEVTPTAADPRRYNLEWGSKRASTIIGGSLYRDFEFSFPGTGGNLVVMNDPEGVNTHRATLTMATFGSPVDVTYTLTTTIPPVRKDMRGSVSSHDMRVPGLTTTVLWLTFEPQVSRTPSRPMYLRFTGEESSDESQGDGGRRLSEITELGPVYVVGSSGETLTFPSVASFAAYDFTVSETGSTSWAVVWPTQDAIRLSVQVYTDEQSSTDHTTMQVVVVPMGSCPN